jgi:hypothetical protein
MTTTPPIDPVPPPILLEFANQFYCLFATIPTMSPHSPQFPLFSTKSRTTPQSPDPYSSILGDIITDLKSMFDVENDVVISFPQLSLSLTEVFIALLTFLVFH